MKNLNIKPLIIIPIAVGLFFTMFINGWSILTGGDATHLTFLNYYNREAIESYPAYYTPLMYLTAILQLTATALLVIALVKREFFINKKATFFKWGILSSILSVALYGFMVRLLSNHGAAANLYYYVVLLYLCLWFIEQRDSFNSGMFTKIKILPIYFILFYTMGFPGWQKIVNSAQVMGGYSKLFSNSFLSKMPGGIEPFIFSIGLLEMAVPILLILSLVKKEFLWSKSTRLLDLSLFLSVSTFIILAFGLSVILNYPGATNLVFYAVFTLGLYAYIHSAKTETE